MRLVIDANTLVAELIRQRGRELILHLEKRTDLLISTLANYIQGLGGNLKLVAEFPENKTIVIKGFADLSQNS
ncbi:hypothetical protein [Geminocystis herdmanii]|uniref:hypothetical protein n=1 Tax=Geminocystis herdmanii TaxID=669359 RepID=UPI0003452169|nr:hypothetical protein [Geminocystis herdmanii]